MAYIGKTPLIGNFQVCDAISTVNNQAAYTMQVSSVNVSPESANNMIVSLNGVIQKPVTSYTVAGSTITFASALVTGDVINFIQILGSVLDLGTPSDRTVTLAKMAAGTDGNLISYDTSGNPVAVATGTDGQVLTSAGAGAVPAFEAAGANTPAFLAYVNGTQSIANNTATTITIFGTEVFDTHSAFASSTFTVPSGGAGKYFFAGSVSTSVAAVNTANQFNLQIKTGSTSLGSVTILRPPYAKLQCSGMADLSVGHTVTMQIYQDSGSAVTIDGDRKVFFGGYKLIT